MSYVIRKGPDGSDGFNKVAMDGWCCSIAKGTAASFGIVHIPNACWTIPGHPDEKCGTVESSLRLTDVL